jgi:hypothetical protein
MPKATKPPPEETSSFSEESDGPPPSKKRRSIAPAEATSSKSPPLKGIKVEVIPPKLDSNTISKLVSALYKLGADVVNVPGKSEVIVTGTTMKQRFVRHVDWDVAVWVQ